MIKNDEFKWLRRLLPLLVLLAPVVTSCRPATEDALPPAETPTPPTAPTEGWAADGVLGDNEYLGEMAYGEYELRWRSDDEYVYIGMRAEATGYISLGIQPESRMKDADMVIGFIGNGEVMVQDAFSTGDFGPHSPDTELGGRDDLLDYGGRIENGYLTIEFQRRLDTGDDLDIPLLSGENQVIWAYGEGSLAQRHTARGYGEITVP